MKPVDRECPPENGMGQPPDADRLQPAFLRFCEIVARLRSPEGCPWDREQTLETIKPYTLEETYELLEAIDTGDDPAIVEELGDLLLQVVLDAQIGADERRFDLIDVIEAISEKMIRRHPHVFGEIAAATKEDVSRNWQRIKQEEKQRDSILEGIPRALPQLARALQITKKAARAGYDFPHRDMLFDKLREELAELAEELFEDGELPRLPASVEGNVTPDQPVADPEKLARIESEIGDVLFVIANIARRWGVNPEEALRNSNQKFSARFQYIEQQVAAQGKQLEEVTLIEMEELYQQGKRSEAG
jgi:MazG family protein